MMFRSIAAAMIFGAATLTGIAQQELSDLVGEARAEWMFGNWEASTDSGESVTLKIGWELDKKVVALHVKTSDMEAKGFAVKDPAGGEEVKYYSFDNKGSVGKGQWTLEGDELVLATETQVPERGTTKAAVVFGGSASEGLKVSMYSVDSSGERVSPARFTLKMKKKS